MRAMLACIVIFIIGYNLGNKQVSDDVGEGITIDTLILEEFSEVHSSYRISTLKTDSTFEVKR